MSASTDNVTPFEASTVGDSSQRPSALPVFTSLRDGPARRVSYRASSKSSSRRSVSRRGDEDDNEEPRHSRNFTLQRSRESLPRPVARETPNGAVTPQQQQDGFSRSSKRSSGGFLLDTSPRSSRLPRLILHRKDIKGKRRSEESQQGTAARDANDSLRSSPLSPSLNSSNQSPSLKPAKQRPYQAHQGQLSTPDHSRSKTSSEIRSDSHVASYGFDTDPSQIVDMALRLNEGRRRQASGKRYTLAATPGKRVVSNGTLLQSASTPPTSIRQYMSTRRQSSNPTTQYDAHKAPEDTQLPEAENDDDDEMRISRATANRVEKAKTYFELAYEHRRLLSHLPPLHRPNPDDSQPPRRLYNPLQYSRNRKLRFREKALFFGELNGWHDVSKVRPWVDAVIDSHAETRHDPLECVRLPPLSLQNEDPGVDDPAHSPKSPSISLTPGKPRRPKSDWQTHPGDLIADAFWCEQGLNKLKLYDHNNDPLFPSGTKFHFSGWRNTIPVQIPDYLQQSPSSPEDSVQRASPPVISAAPGLPTFESAHKNHPWSRKKSNIKRLVKQDNVTQKKIASMFDSSSETSDPDSPEKEPAKRGRKRLARYRARFQGTDADPLSPGTLDRASSTDGADTLQKSVDVGHSDHNSSKRSSIEHANLLAYLHRNSVSKGSTNDESDHKKSSKRRALLANLKLHHDPDRPRSSLDYDSPSPASPIVDGLPSIAINLSPPTHRAPDASKTRRKALPGASEEMVETADFATRTSKNSSRAPSAVPSANKSSSQDHSREVSPATRGPSPFTKHPESEHGDAGLVVPLSDRSPYSLSKSSTRTSQSKDPQLRRIRGMFKGGRIAELVGNEVSRVGDYIWKRDVPRAENGSVSGYESESDEAHEPAVAALRTPPREQRPKLTQQLSRTSQKSTRSNRPATAEETKDGNNDSQYHIQGLPSFTSPFQRDREAQERRRTDQSPGGTRVLTDPEDDHISRLAAEHRSVSKSPRLDHLAPPKLNIEGPSTSDSPRRKSYGFGAALDLTKTRSASQLFNDAINSENKSLSVTGSIASMVRPFLRPSLSDIQQATVNQETKGPATFRHEILRTRALLVMTAVKGNLVHGFCEAVPQPAQSQFLLDSLQATNSMPQEGLSVRRKDEHVMAAWSLIDHLSKQSATFNHKLDHFSREIAQSLHREAQILEDRVENKLTPRVQEISDRAGMLSQSLATTSTLAVKSVNDAVAEAVRLNRRSGLRFSRRFAYKLIEGAIVGLLWLIWLVATVIRFVVGSIKLLGRIVRWLLWVD